MPINAETLGQLEDAVSRCVVDAIPYIVHIADPDNPSPLPTFQVAPFADPTDDSATTRLPVDLQNALTSGELTMRMVTIDGIDCTACCGTHVADSSQLGAVAIQPTPQRVRGVNFRIQFAVGDRVRKLLRTCQLRDAQITSLMSCGAPEFVERIEKTLSNSKLEKKQVKATQDELTRIIAQTIVQASESLPEPSSWLHYHRETPSSMDLLFGIANILKSEHKINVVLSSVAAEGMLCVLVGKIDEMKLMIPQVTDAVTGIKGGGGKGKPGSMVIWQGRAPKVQSLDGLNLRKVIAG
jgi:alanyl-tRNA synthetase